MNYPFRSDEFRMLPPVFGPSSKHWSIVTKASPTIHVGYMVKKSYEPFEVGTMDSNGEVARRAHFESVGDAITWLERHCRLPVPQGVVPEVVPAND